MFSCVYLCFFFNHSTTTCNYTYRHTPSLHDALPIYRFWGIKVRSDDGLDVMAPLAGRFIQFRPWPFGKMKKVPLREIVARSPEGEAARRAAIAEDSRQIGRAPCRERVCQYV